MRERLNFERDRRVAVGWQCHDGLVVPTSEPISTEIQHLLDLSNTLASIMTPKTGRSGFQPVAHEPSASFSVWIHGRIAHGILKLRHDSCRFGVEKLRETNPVLM
jgi:hypothetical protein